MIVLGIEDVRRRAAERPVGYLEDVLASGRVIGEQIELEEGAYNELLGRYRPAPVSLAQKLANFGLEAAKWVAAGMPIVSLEVLAARARSCYACEDWATEGLVPHCRVCGCLEMKHELATSECPKGKWGKGSAIGLQAP